jgi:hypothetical protein
MHAMGKEESIKRERDLRNKKTESGSLEEEALCFLLVYHKRSRRGEGYIDHEGCGPTMTRLFGFGVVDPVHGFTAETGQAPPPGDIIRCFVVSRGFLVVVHPSWKNLATSNFFFF